jgi:hypothetical protein
MKHGGVSFLLATLAAASGAVAVTATPAAAATVLHVAKTGTDTPGCGATSAPCATIPYAYGLAAAGDTIEVAAGTYVLTAPLAIAKAGLRLEGAKAGVDARTRVPGEPGETVITASLTTPAPRAMFAADADSVTINGFSFDGNADGAGVSTSEQHSGYRVSDDIFADNLTGLAPSSDGAIASVFDKDLYYDNNNATRHPGSQGNGVFTYRPLASASFTNSRFHDNHNAPVNIAGGEIPGGSRDITIADNDMDGEFPVTLVAVSHVSITKNQMTGGWSGVQVSGACHEVTITRNTIKDKTRGGILLFTGFAAVTNTGITIADNIIDHTATVPGRYGIEISRGSHIAIHGNLITDSGHGGIGFTARDQDVPSSAVTIEQNTITGSGGPGISVAHGTYTGAMTVRYNRIVDNGLHHGLVNDADAHIDAQLNWWGCNHMPDGGGCDHPAGSDSARVSYRPWLVLTLYSDPSGQLHVLHAKIIATLRKDSDGGSHDGPFFHPVTVTFRASTGSLRDRHVTTSALLRATALWHAVKREPGTVCATVDHQTNCLDITFTPEGPDITPGEPESGRPTPPAPRPTPPVVPVTG